MAYQCIVWGRWMTNDAEPTEVDHGSINNVYTVPLLPSPFYRSLSFFHYPPSYHSESEEEHEPAEISSPSQRRIVPPFMWFVTLRLLPTPDAASVPDVESEVPTTKEVQETVVPAAAVEGSRCLGGPSPGREGGRHSSFAPLLS